MLFPYHDDTPRKRFPLVTFSLIGINVAVYVLQITMQEAELAAFYSAYGAVPLRFAEYRFSEGLVSPLTHMFIHGSLVHLLGNLWFLWLFGDNVEDSYGPFRFLGFYIVGGLAGMALHVLVFPSSPVPLVGASAAISAVMGAYWVFYPRARIGMVAFVFIFIKRFHIPTFVYMMFWFGFQMLYAFIDAVNGGQADVAFSAHIGGFAFGLLAGLLWKMRRVPA
ncbi:rhomboid family intramembrane serine protease [bacterium]|nr:rhomboid family intramembrane serine protease [bacterium]